MVYNTNAFLSMSEMTVNAQYILDFFTSKNWDKKAISAMLGNMQSESSMNFGIYEGLNSSSSTNGFGIVQWTPNTKYFNWANANGYGSDNINGELNRIIYEVDNHIQWIANGHQLRYGLSPAYDISFSDFIHNTGGYTVEQLADAWMWNYEGPANPDQPNRATQARYWFDNLTGGTIDPGGGGGTTPSTDSSKIVSMLLSNALNGW